MFYSYTRRKHKKCLSNNCSRFFKSLSQYFLVTEGGMRLCKVKVLKKREKKEEKKDKCPRKKEE